MFSVSLLPSKTTPEPGETIELFGTVYADSTPIKDLKVVLLINGAIQKEAFTDRNGNFKFEISLPTAKTYYAYVEVYAPERLAEEFASLGDINSDGVINEEDRNLLSKAYHSVPGSPNWNPKCDLNKDNKVDLKDLTILSKNYGLTIEEWLKKR
ncbi:MAG: hypothetical protein K6T73_07435 [Candidatus Bathyarchaeota archaeon]|nr:hypothetical protein [Candidatus Bathyarchaeota archaeon]